jgi:LysR family nitrogen assimilation transcriptional regulator
MKFDELRYFLKAAEAGSMSRASENLGMTQPALSRQIRQLERELRSDLFYRHGRGVSLTPSGIRLREVAVQVLEQLALVSQEIQEDSANENGMVTLGVPPSIGATLCAPLSSGFAKIYPHARLRIREGFSGSLSEMLEAGRLDLAILYDARRRRDLLVTPLIRENLYLITPRQGAARTENVGWDDVRNADLILPGPENGMRRVIERAARAADVSLTIRLEIDSVPAIRQLVASGAGAAILPYGAVHADVRAGILDARIVKEPGMEALLVVATPRSKPVTRTVRSLIKAIEAETLNCIRSEILRGEYRPTASEPDPAD